MWPFKKSAPSPALDPIGDICRAIIDRPWEWTFDDVALRHTSGVAVVVTPDPTKPSAPPGVALRMVEVRLSQSDDDAYRLACAIEANMAARVLAAGKLSAPSPQEV